MRTKVVLLFISIGLLALFSCSEPIPKDLPDGLYANIITNKGRIICRLEHKLAPMTVANFIGLSEGTIENTFKPLGEPYFNGLTFHRVDPGFVIQGGDPNGNGMGGPGYAFPNEVNPKLSHNVAGTLAMANSGPDTNGSQFYITHKARTDLDNRYSVFGYVAQDLTTVYKIEIGDEIQKIEIIRLGEEAQTFDAPTIFKELSGVTGVK